MPIEIKELLIKAVVQDNCGTNSQGSPATSESQINAIVAQCVEQVMSILKEKQER